MCIYPFIQQIAMQNPKMRVIKSHVSLSNKFELINSQNHGERFNNPSSGIASGFGGDAL